MTWPAFTALAFLAALASERPAEFRHDPERIATIAIAAERAQSATIASWRRHPRLLGASMIATSIGESGLTNEIHMGAVRGGEGEICLMQIHPVNALWKRWGEFENLAGVEIELTAHCLVTGAETLIGFDRYCSRKGNRDWLRRMFSGYSGASCRVTELATNRAALTNRIAWTNWQPTDSHRQAIAWALRSERGRVN
jgi:hypothetical protein